MVLNVRNPPSVLDDPCRLTPHRAGAQRIISSETLLLGSLIVPAYKLWVRSCKSNINIRLKKQKIDDLCYTFVLSFLKAKTHFSMS